MATDRHELMAHGNELYSHPFTALMCLLQLRFKRPSNGSRTTSNRSCNQSLTDSWTCADASVRT